MAIRALDSLEADMWMNMMRKCSTLRGGAPAPSYSRVHFSCRCLINGTPWQVGEDARFARRAARYYLYRKWVNVAHGRLGKRVRVRIPPCVVEFIRDCYREPNCTCGVGGSLYGAVGGDCTGHHGYTGHREAAPADEDEDD